MKPRTLLAIHRWIALAFAPLLFLQAVTGSALLFQEELSSIVGPTRISQADEGLPISAIAASARSAWPGQHLRRIFLPQDSNGYVFAQLEGPNGAVRHAAIDPGSGVILAKGTIWDFPLEAALQMHYRLASGTVGLVIISLMGCALVLIGMSGFCHWWPGGKRVGQALKIPTRTPKRLRLRAWHRTTGAMLAAVLLTMSITGLTVSLPEVGAALAPVPAGPQPAPVVPAAAGTDRAYGLAQTEFPGQQARDIRFRPDGSIAVNFFAADGGAWDFDSVTVSALDGKVIARVPHQDNEAAWTVTLPIHTGSIAGELGRWMILAAAGGLLFLSISGPIAWLRARKTRTKRT